MPLLSLGEPRVLQGHLPEAYGLFAESVAAQREAGDELGIAESLLGMGTVAALMGNTSTARALLGQSLALAHALNMPMVACVNLESLAAAYEHEGASREALRLLAASEQLRHLACADFLRVMAVAPGGPETRESANPAL